MIELRRVVSSLRTGALLLLLAACGSSNDSRPIEVIFYVDGLSGTRFTVEGLQAANANHHLPDRTFEAPFFFVMENARQFSSGAGIRGCFRNLPDELSAITIFTYYGTAFQERVVLQPGQCYGPGYDPQNPPDCADFVNPCDQTDDIDVKGPEVRFEVCVENPGGTCSAAAAPTGPANLAFTASTGDFNATTQTTCAVPEAAISFCTTGSIFYLEDPADRLQAIFTKVSNQTNDFDLQADAYVNGDLRASNSSGHDVIIDQGL